MLCGPDFQVELVVELDDHTHRGREYLDAVSDGFLSEAGIDTGRFYQLPARGAVVGMFARLPAVGYARRANPPYDEVLS